MPELGDLSNLFENTVPNLDWLDIDEKAYRSVERLPHQNLDIKPDLVRMWSTHDKGPTHFVPNIDLSMFPEIKPKDAKVSSQAHQVIAKQVKNRMMAGWSGEKVAAWIREHVEPEMVIACMPMFRKIAEEQGLLGNVYLDATDWGNCDQGEGEAIAKKASSAKYVLAKEAKCAGCVFKEGGVCSKFRKELVFDVVPYTEAMVNDYASTMKMDLPATVASSKDRLRDLFVSASIEVAPEVPTRAKETLGAQEKRDLLASRGSSYESPIIVASDMPVKYRVVVAGIYRAAYDGVYGRRLRDDMVEKFGRGVVLAASEYITPIAKMAELLGTVVIDLRGFKRVADAKEYIASRKVKPGFLLREGCCSESCGEVEHGEGCMSPNFPDMTVIPSDGLDQIPDDYVMSSVDALEDHGNLAAHQAASLRAKIGSTPNVDILRAAHTLKPVPTNAPFRPVSHTKRVENEKVAKELQEVSAGKADGKRKAAEETVRTRIARVMNTGRMGAALKRWIRNSFSPDVIKAESKAIASALEEHGLMGHYYVDPKLYTACDDGAKEVAASKAKYVLAMKKCNGCTYRHQNDRCSVYNRTVVADVPYEDGKEAAQSAILNPVVNTVEMLASVNVNPVSEYQVSGGYGLVIAMDPVVEREDLDVGFDDALGNLSDDI